MVRGEPSKSNFDKNYDKLVENFIEKVVLYLSFMEQDLQVIITPKFHLKLPYQKLDGAFNSLKERKM